MPNGISVCQSDHKARPQEAALADEGGLLAFRECLRGAVHTQRAVTVFSSRKSRMEARRDFALPRKEVFFEPRGKKA